MKKIISLLIAISLLLITVFGLNQSLKKKLSSQKVVSVEFNENNIRRNSDKFLINKILDENTALILGSSELYSRDEIGFPSCLFGNQNSDFKTVLMGQGYMQSLHQAIVVGANSNIIKNGKTAIIMSPQWFSKSGLQSEQYASRFSEISYFNMLQNKDLSIETKKKITKRLKFLLKSSPQQLSRINEYEATYLTNKKKPLSNIKCKLFFDLLVLKNRLSLIETLNKSNYDQPPIIKKEDIDFGNLILKAEQAGRNSTQNNHFGIENDYFNKYVKPNLEKSKNNSKYNTLDVSPEYDDFCLFLEVCEELNIEPLVILVPLNGVWSDYTGLSKEQRNKYYSNIRKICKDKNVELADFSDKEYEKYFFKDIMHVGWKGWVYIDEAIYKFYNK